MNATKKELLVKSLDVTGILVNRFYVASEIIDIIAASKQAITVRIRMNGQETLEEITFQKDALGKIKLPRYMKYIPSERRI